MAQTGFQPATANDASHWTNPDNAHASDDAYADTNDQTSYEVYKTFNLPTIPAGSTITSIQARIEGHAVSVDSSVLSIKVSGDAGSTWSSSSINATYDTGTDQTKTWGGLFGETWSPSHFTNANFRLRLGQGAAGNKLNIDFIEANVIYTLPPVTKTHTTDSYLKAALTKAHTTDSLTKKAATLSHSTDTLLRITSLLQYTSDSLLKKEASISHNTDTLLSAAGALSHSTDSFLKKTQTAIHTTDSYLLQQVSTIVWVSPADEATEQGSTTPLVFEIPPAEGLLHFELQIDSVATFDSMDLQVIKSWADQTNWEFHDGVGWTALPEAGVDPDTYAGNQARYNPTMEVGTWYRRIRGRIIVTS